MERVEHPEGLDDGDGGGLAELHGGRADANPLGGGGDLADQHGGRRAGYGDEVVLGDPVPLVSPLFGVLCQVDGVSQCRCGVGAFADRRQVQDRERNGHDFAAFVYRLTAIGRPSRSRSVSPSR